MGDTIAVRLLAVLAVAVAACTAGPGEDRTEVTGVVIAVEGDLESVDAFTILTSEGTELTLTPEPGLLFDGGPLIHLQEHVRSGVPVRVVYTAQPDGTNIAHEIGDA